MLHIGYHAEEELDIELEGKELAQVDGFVYRRGQCAETGRRREGYVEEHMPERTSEEQLRGDGGPVDLQKKGEVMSTYVTPACLYGTETLALAELQQQRLQVCENNWVRQIASVTRADRRTIVELREDTGVHRSLTGRMVINRL